MKILLLGATSDIGRALALRLARTGDHYLLAARDAVEGETAARDLAIRTGAEAAFVRFDACEVKGHGAFIAAAIERLGGLDGVIVCFGYLGAQAAAQGDFAEAARIIEVNFTAAVALLEPAAAHLEERGAGFIVGLTSVAGERGRGSNYLYGAAKGALTIYLEGLAHRLAPRGVRVKIAKLGFVRSKMTRGLSLPGFLQSTPEQAARGIERLLRSQRQAAFIPARWGLVMAVIRALPASIFNRSNL